MATNTSEIRNGTRHAQSLNADSPNARRSPSTIIDDANNPMVGVIGM